PGLERREDPRARRSRRHPRDGYLRGRRNGHRPPGSGRSRGLIPTRCGQRLLLPEFPAAGGAAVASRRHGGAEMETDENGGFRAVSITLFTALFAGQAALIAMSPVLTEA